MAPVNLRRRLVAGTLLAGPLLLYIVLRLNPELDPRWHVHIFHFYIVSFTSLVALVVASFILLGIGEGDAHALFVATAFVAVAGLFLIHGISTPGVLIRDFNQAVG